MEKTVVSASAKAESFYHPRLFVVFTGAFLLGCYDGLCAYVFAFLYLAYFYMRDEKEYCDIAGFLFLWFYHYLFLCAWDDHIFFSDSWSTFI